MKTEYEVLPYIGKKRAKKLAEAGIGIEEIAKMDEEQLKKHIPRISSGKLKIIIATARELSGVIYNIVDTTGIDKAKAKILAINNYDVDKLAHAKRDELAKLLNISEDEAFDIIFKTALKTGAQKPKVEIKKEEISDMGIVSKHGFVNGFTALKFEKTRRFNVVPFIVVLIVVISAITASVYLLSPSLKIDGNFSDWNGIPGYKLGPLTYKYSYQSGALYFFLHENSMFSQQQRFYVFIDTGSNSGYYVDGIKASYVAEFYGWNSTLKGAALWKHASDTMLWNFSKATGMDYAPGNDGIEFMLNHVPEHSRAIVMANNGTVTRSAPFAVDRYTAQVVVSTPKRIVSNGDTVLTLNITAPVKFKVDTVVINYQGAEITSAMLNYSSGSVSGSCSNNTVEFNINSNVQNAQLKISAEYNAEPGTVLSLKAYVQASNIAVSYINETANVYLFSAPKKVHIDGAFGDWKNISYDAYDSPAVYDQNVNLTSYAHTSKFDKVYFAVNGEFMGGTDVPIARAWAPKDSDHDTVPDKYDKYPHDFNNDGIPDSETNHDVDGDGYKDYPYGNDTWLNTTIPADYPKPYAGRHVSVYIGPPPPVKPKSGNDTAELYFYDPTASVGTHLDWVPFTVNYKITITGRDGLYSSKLYQFTRSGWKFMHNITNIASGYHAVELATGLNITHGKMWLYIANWNNSYDMPSIAPTRRRAATTTDVFYLHADLNKYPKNMNWTEYDNKMKEELTNGNGDVRTWQYETPVTKDFYISSATLTFWYEDEDGITYWRYNKYLNVSLYDVDGSNGNKKLVGYSGAIKITQGDTNPHEFNISLNILSINYISKGNYLNLSINYTANSWASGIYFYYNSTQYPSRLNITTNSTIQITHVWTVNDNTREYQSNFTKGDEVGVYANVTDPLGVAHINTSSVYISIIDPLQNIQKNNQQMNLYSSGSGYGIFNYTFSLSWSPYVYVGKYIINVSASDRESAPNTVNASENFWINSAVKQAGSKRMFVPPGNFHAWFRHKIVNMGGGDDIFNLNVSSHGAPQFEVTIYRDVNWNKIIDSQDTLYAVYNSSRGGWVYKKNNTDGNVDPDITVPYGSQVRILIQVNVSLSQAKPDTYVNLTVYSFTGNSSYTVHDLAKVRDVKSKTLYLRGGGDVDTSIPDTLYPVAPKGTSDIYIQNTGNTWQSWNMNFSFANDFVIAGNITAKVYILNPNGPPLNVNVNISLTLNDGALVGYSTLTTNGDSNKNVYLYTLTITPKISLIPAGDTLLMSWNTNGKASLYFNSTSYDSHIIFNTTSYIYVQNTTLYNVTSGVAVPQNNYSAGDDIAINATVLEPFGEFDIKKVYANITAPNGMYSILDLNASGIYSRAILTYFYFNSTYALPSDSVVGLYYVNVTAVEGNGVTDTLSTTFTVKCNVAISPHTNASTGTTVWYYHTIWNNGSGEDIINIDVSSNQTANITLYVYNTTSGTWDIAAYSNTGTHWNHVESGYDNDGNGVPDVIVARHSYARIKIKVTASANLKTYLNISSAYASCTDSALDSTTVPELNPLMFLIFVPALILLQRKRK